MWIRLASMEWQAVQVAKPAALIEHDDRWVLPYRGLSVDQIRVDHQLTLILDGDAQIIIGTSALLTLGSVSTPDTQAAEVVPEQQEIAAALPLFGTSVLSSIAFKSGSLRVVFDNGLHLNVKPNPEYEAWDVTGPANLRLASMPGGGLAVWR